MRINVAIPEAHVDAPVLDAALESVTRLNEQLLKAGVPTFDRALHETGIRWKPEPPGQEHFDHAALVMKRGFGDCDDLAPWHAASLRHTGEDRHAQAIVKRSGPKRWHAVVQRGDGRIDDPSAAAGMHDYAPGVVGATLPLMWAPPSGVSGAYVVRPQIAMRPFYGGFQARADLPWHWREHLEHDTPEPTDYAMTTLHTAPLASTALTGCLDGACRFAEIVGFSTDEHMDRLACIADVLDGADGEELAEMYGDDEVEAAEEIVGSLFSGLARGLKKITRPLRGVVKRLGPAAQFLPGPLSQLPGAFEALQSGDPMQMARAAMAAHSGQPGGRAPNIFELQDIVARNPELAPLVHMAQPFAGMAMAPFLGPLAPMVTQYGADIIAPPQGAPPGGAFPFF